MELSYGIRGTMYPASQNLYPQSILSINITTIENGK